MRIEDNIIVEYLNENRTERYRNNWIFDQIEEGRHCFEEPDSALKDKIKTLYWTVKEILESFRPFNRELFNRLFPSWEELSREQTVLLVVGCPKPYDALTMSRHQIDYIILDLIRFQDYINDGNDAVLLIRKLLTHELAHICIHKRFKFPEDKGMMQEMRYLTFDESFAHYLAFTEQVAEYDFHELIRTYYQPALSKLKEVFAIADGDEKKYQFLKGFQGTVYWEKFGATAGQLYLAGHPDEIVEIFNAGPENFLTPEERLQEGLGGHLSSI